MEVLVGTRGTELDDWDDADRPLQMGVELASSPGGGSPPSGGGLLAAERAAAEERHVRAAARGNVWGIDVGGAAGYAQLD